MFCVKSSKSVQYFQSSDVPSVLENSPVFVSKTQAKQLNLLVEPYDILVTGFGTIGNIRLVSKHQKDVCFANNVCRIRVNDKKHIGLVFSILSSKYGRSQLEKNASGSVVRYIEAPGIKKTLIPLFSDEFQEEINNLIMSALQLREEATDSLKEAENVLKKRTGLNDLSNEDYDYYGPSDNSREVSCFVRNIKDIGKVTFNAFNHSERIKRHVLAQLRSCNTISFYDALDEDKLQSPTGVAVNEVEEGHGIMLINQSDIFDQIVKGKWVAKKDKYTKDLLNKEEILIAKIGTLGESESFCRCIYIGEELEGQLISSAFYRMKPNPEIPAGYLYTWLASDYGFRLIRSSQYGTKQCYPNPAILYDYPVPLLDKESMLYIDGLVKEAHHKQHLANDMIRKAVSLVESEIEK